ncbi:MAG TPA: SRPBCC family protein [Mycobacteriales bacterium]|nr:SRPBCC family protein [Mycobacteriales bacterium]
MTIAESIEFDGPVSAAYNQWTQFESFPQFTNGVESITQSDDTHTHWMVTAGGASREFDAEITEQHRTNGWPGSRQTARPAPAS